MARCALFLSILLAALLPVANAADEAAPPATLLVARAELPDPNFSDSVILLTQRNRLGPAGVIINKPTRVRLAELFPDIKALNAVDDKVFFGGPVAMNTLSFVFRSAKEPDEAMEIMKDIYVSSDMELLRELLSRERPAEDLRVFVGYAGWAPAQLDNELARGDWRKLDADPRAIFARRPEALWPLLDQKASTVRVRAVLRFTCPGSCAPPRGPGSSPR